MKKSRMILEILIGIILLAVGIFTGVKIGAYQQKKEDRDALDIATYNAALLQNKYEEAKQGYFEELDNPYAVPTSWNMPDEKQENPTEGNNPEDGETSKQGNNSGEKSGVTPVTTPKATPGATPTATPKVTPRATPTATPKATPGATPKATPTVTPKPTSKVTPTLTPAPTKAPAKPPQALTDPLYYGALHVSGTKLVDSKNKPVVLRGISTHGIGWFPDYVNDSAFRQFKQEWGCNVIRLAMYTDENAGYCVVNADKKKKIKETVIKGIDAAIKNDMYVIVDWHILSDNNPLKYMAEAQKFFEEISKKYAKNPHVLYEICNEPNGSTTWNDIKKYAKVIIPIIRANSPDAVIIVGSTTWSQDVDEVAKSPITEYKNLAYSLHFYAGTHKQNLRDKAQKAIDKGLCLLVTEFGVCDASGNGALDTKEADRWIEFLDKNDIGYIIWNLSNKNESSSLLKASCRKVNGFTADDISKECEWFLNVLKKAVGGCGAKDSGTTEAGQGTNDKVEAGGEDSPIIDYAEFEKYLTATKGVSFSVSNVWENEKTYGMQVDFYIESIDGKAEKDWTRKIKLKDSGKLTISQQWNTQATIKDGALTLKAESYNRELQAGATIGGIGVIFEIKK